MRAIKSQAVICSLVILLQYGINIQVLQAAPNDGRQDQQGQDTKDQEQRRQDQQRQGQQRQGQQRQEQQRQEQYQDQQRQGQQRQEQYQEQQRQGQQRQEQQRHHDWSHPAYSNDNWVHSDTRADGQIPFSWREHHNRYYGERINDREWNDRFPGLRSYKWRGEGFRYRGRNIQNCILFYDDSDELVSIGFMDEGVFVFLRDDDERYDNHDSYILMWLFLFLL